MTLAHMRSGDIKTVAVTYNAMNFSEWNFPKEII
jgi:hypothetical protein